MLLYTLLLFTSVAGFDPEEIWVLLMAFGGLVYVVADLKRERALDDKADEWVANTSALEAQVEGLLASHKDLVESCREHRSKVAKYHEDVIDRLLVLEMRSELQRQG